MNPKISIITPSYNQRDYIEENILSVMAQNYHNFEHIIIDGGSTDGTIEILEKYPHLKWKSEKDEGQADALRKGFELCSGEIVGWLNSDDFYEPNIFLKIIEAYRSAPNLWYIGDLNVYDSVTGKSYFEKTPNVSKLLSVNPYVVRQPAAFYSYYLLKSVGGFNPSFYMVMDYDLWIRLIARMKPIMLEVCISNFREHPDQKSTFKNLGTQTKEILKIVHREKNYISYFAIIFKVSKSVLKQFKRLIRNHG